MKSLLYLSFLKLRGTIRNQFRTVTSAVITVLLILVYGGMAVMIFTNSSAYVPETMRLSTNMAILAGLGMTGLFTFTVMMNKRKALVYDTDAYYLFAGPYSRKQVNGFILLQSALQAMLYALLGCFVMAMTTIGGYFSVPFFFVSLLVFFLLTAFFLVLTDYIYMWSLADKRYKKCTYAVVLLLLVSVGIVFFFSMRKAGYVWKDGFLEFALSREFYYVPFFGWGKKALNAFLEKQYLSMLSGLLPLLACNGVLGLFFLNFKKDIVEQAVKDAEEVSSFVRKAKANGGNAQDADRKVKKIKGEFPEGAKAVFFKNMLIMRKTGNFLRKQDVLIIVFYFVISYVTASGNRFYMFCYMMVLWLFNLLNDAELMGDLKNYQIYLIPEPPLKKLVYAILPAYFKIAIVISASIIFAGVFNKMPPLAVLQYLVMLLGYGMIFIAGTVLSVRILKTRTNMMLENLLRMLIILLSAIPSAVIGFVCYIFLKDLQSAVSILSVVTLVMNFAVSVLIILACQGMMNGREE